MDTTDKVNAARDEFFSTHVHPLDRAASILESPIERLMFWHLVLAQGCVPSVDFFPTWGLPGCRVVTPPGDTSIRNKGADCLTFGEEAGEHATSLWTQVTIESHQPAYRLDFVIDKLTRVPGHFKGVRTFLVVECDGHDFHERTKEQAKRDKGRDRSLQALGYRVARFTGSEIFGNPVAVAEEAWSLARKIHSEAVKAAKGGD